MDQTLLQMVQKAIAKVRNELGLGTDRRVTDAGGEPLILVAKRKKSTMCGFEILFMALFFLIQY